MKTFKPIFKTATFLLWLCLIPASLEAFHIVGGDMRYECLGNNQYRIYLKVYRDCGAQGQNVAPFDNPAPITVYDGAGNFVSNTNVSITNGPTGIPVSTGNPCIIPPAGICVEEAEYITTLTLPFNPNGYHVSYQRCCRNTTITNIFNPNSYGATFTIFISDLAQTTCNTSPIFNAFPPVVICANQPFSFDHGATDPEGDSLVYSFCAPFTGLSSQNPGPTTANPPPYTNVPFIPPLSATSPIGGNPAMTINPQTGLITGFPIQTGQYVVGICVEEYRNGVLISTSKRDFQFNITTCAVTVQADILEDQKIGFRNFVINSCADTVLQIINQSGQAQFITGYAWRFNFSNGTAFTSATTSPTITFPGYGVYQGTLVVNPGSLDCTDTAFITVNIFPPPIADFSYFYDSCVIGPVFFTDLSTTGEPQDTMTSYLWDFDDGSTADTLNPIYQYQNSGSFDVSLTVVDENGCTDSQTRTLIWAPTPIIEVVPSSFVGCVPGEIAFQNNSYPINGYTTVWDLGDGSFSNAASPTHIYNQAGIYTVSITITSPLNCQATDTFTNLITIYEPPQANATVSFDSCEVGPVQFTDLSIPGDTGIRYWTWDLADGNIAVDTNVLYQYLLAGSYDVTLTVRDFNNCVDSFTQTIDWFPAPIFLIGQNVYEGCSPFTVQIENNSYPINGYDLLWDMGDGTTSTDADPINTYYDIGKYTLALRVISPTGCVGEQTFPNLVEVEPKPEADFKYSPYPPSSLNPTLDFQDLSQDAIAWQWAFGTGATSLQQNPTYTYPDTGHFQVMLVATHPSGCQDTIYKIVDIEPRFTFYLPNAFTPNEDDLNDGFRGTGILEGIQDYSMKIWNRWGEMIFESSDPMQAWNGRKNNTGEWVKNGVYVCIVQLKSPRGEPYEYRTNVVVVR